VQDWLHDSKNGQWLLFLENLDDARFLLDIHLDIQPHLGNLDIQSHSGNLESRASKPLRDYLPKSLNGSILITSRNREAALELVNQSDIIVVERMDEQHALALFEKKLRRQDISEDVVELAAALDFIPLAIVQAAAYISHQASHLSVREYLMMLREGVQLHRNQEAKNSVISTWQVSFEHIREIRPSACDLLSLMSFFDRQGIPECLLQSRTPYGITQQDQKGRSENNTDDKEESESQSRVIEEFEEDVSVLRNYSLICLDTHMTIFEMDEMVQLATRQWLETNGQLEKWRQQCIRNLCAEFPTGEFQNWTKCQELFPHAKSIVMQRPEEPPSSLMEWASILYKAAWYAWGQGNGSDAEKMSIMAMDTRKELLGQENVETLNSMTMVALIYDFKGRWKEAEELEVQVMATSKRVLGATHPSTLTSMNNLASTYRNQGRWNEAEELEMQAMEMRKKIFGIEHPDTLTSMSNLASTYRNQGRWDDAKELEVQVMEMRKKIFGVEHPDTLTAMDNLASTLSNKGQWKEAEELELQVMDMRKKIFGAQHPSTLTSMSNLASTYRNQGLWKEAENLDVQVIETRERVLGAEHPDTLTSMENLAFTWKGIGEDAEAMKLMEECIKLRKRILGADHPHALTSSKALAKWKAEQEDVGDKV
jgi:tetratricopeptide (TPR) repeat protein